MNREQKQNKNTLINILIPLLCAILFMALCMINLKSSVWFDEAYSAYLIRGDFTDIWQLTAVDVHPPVYYFCLKIWSLIFGTSDFALRFMSVFFGAMTIIVLFYLLRRWFGTKTSAVATFFLTLSPMFIRYGQEMRMYMLVFFIVVLATYVLDLALSTKKTRYYILYGLLISLGMWTHYFTAIAWIAHIVYYMATRRGKIWDKKFLLAYGLAVVLFIPWIPSFFQQTNSVQGGFWIPELSFNTAAGYISEALVFKDAGSVTNWLAILLIFVIVVIIFAATKVYKKLDNKTKRSFLFLLSLVVLPPVGLMLLSVPPFKPIFVSRYVTYAAALLWALIGTIVAEFIFIKTRESQKKVTTRILQKAPAAIMLVLVLTTAIIGIVNVETRESDSHAKESLLAVSAISDDGTPILPYDEWAYYDMIFYSTDKHPVYGLNSLVDIPYNSFLPIERYKVNTVDDDTAFLASHPKVWYLVKNSELPKDFSEFELPEVFNGYHIKTEVSDQYYTALELEKE